MVHKYMVTKLCYNYTVNITIRYTTGHGFKATKAVAFPLLARQFYYIYYTQIVMQSIWSSVCDLYCISYIPLVVT